MRWESTQIPTNSYQPPGFQAFRLECVGEGKLLATLPHQQQQTYHHYVDLNVITFAPIVEPLLEPESLEELLYCQYGYSLDEVLDQPMLLSQHNSECFNTWT